MTPAGPWTPRRPALICVGVFPPSFKAFVAVPAVIAWRASGTIPDATATPLNATNSAIMASANAGPPSLSFIVSSFVQTT